jgi:uncharacterized protein (TIGR02246 family)
MTVTSKPTHFLDYSVALLLLLALPNAHAQREDVRAAVEAGNKKFLAALSRADAAGLSGLYTTNAQVFPTHSDIVRGKQAIEQFWKGVIDSGVKGAVLKTLEVERRGDTAYEVGTYSMTGEGGKVVDAGKYVVIWKRQEGQWKLHRDIWNTNRPASEH